MKNRNRFKITVLISIFIINALTYGCFCRTANDWFKEQVTPEGDSYVVEDGNNSYYVFAGQKDTDAFSNAYAELYDATEGNIDSHYDEYEYVNGHVQKKGSNTTVQNNKTTNKTPAKAKACEHDYISEMTLKPTCVEEGITTYTCSKCGDTYTESIPVDKNAHDLKEEVVDVEPTCTTDGSSSKSCSLCEYKEISAIPALGHDYVSEVTTKPACIEEGITTYTCSRCSDTYTEPINALGHNEGEFIIDKEANLFFNGSKHTECTACGEVITTEIINSKYPVWYLYIIIGIIVVLIAVIVTISMKKKSNITNSDN